ncbi:MAG: DUF1592 domain-containing protein, partial [Rubripirellula sp.]
MKYLLSAFVAFVLPANVLFAESFKDGIDPLLESSCIGCHDASTDTDLDFGMLGNDLSDPVVFRMWERIFDRVHDGDMPPASEDRPEPSQLKSTLATLEQALHRASIERQERVGRVPARRLTKAELGYTLRDLLLIDGDATRSVPDEVESGSFDTVGANQRISAVHMASYLTAADEALAQAIQVQKNPYRTSDEDFEFLKDWHEKPLSLGGSVTRELKFGKGIVLFRDIDYLTQFRHYVMVPGVYRLKAKLAAYQSKRPVTAKLIVKNPSGAARLVMSQDLQPGGPRSIVVDTYLEPGETPYLTFRLEQGFGSVFAGGAKDFKGVGLAILSQQAEGPLHETWPPPSTQRLLKGMKLVGSRGRDADGPYRVADSEDPLGQVAEVVRSFAPRAFRRAIAESELQPFIDLAEPAIADGREPLDAVRIPLRAMLTSPQFLMFGGEVGELDDYALANRLSYFLWKSMPDEELLRLADDGKLSDAEGLSLQVDRMLEDEKSKRFVNDFLGQWLRLDQVNVTSPDEGLYPEYDELLGDSIPKETE